jgi:integrase
VILSLHDIVRAQRPERLPVVLTIEEVREVIGEVAAPAKLVVQLLYGSGLRLLEALRAEDQRHRFVARPVDPSEIRSGSSAG